MSKNLTLTQFNCLIVIPIYALLTFILLKIGIIFSFTKNNPSGFEILLGIFVIFSLVFLAAVLLIIIMDDDYDFGLNFIPKYRSECSIVNKTFHKIMENKKKIVRNTIIFGAFIVLAILLKGFYNDIKSVYNTNQVYLNTYNQKVQERQQFYDKLYTTYVQKNQIAAVNKDIFLQVTKIIMEGRHDGQQVTWKWLKENQNIPYEEFTKFYADLSSFINDQREGYFALEKDCQVIANKNNIFLSVWPNNLYSKILGCQKINYDYGKISNHADQVFTSKRENVE